ncbi:MAG TPA: tRNA (N(6)-L-threonylcarbamoyladenosine(37)-C(2))-methylthiotransferase MtaB [Candidatus Acidoferrales bacterium]|nr:tRNA (N(6)-L-threonylcarbamoyladenosine(37)-C(2))-methylthiotransferase MtaB [Candidatus Acidoferrales bacterium]
MATFSIENFGCRATEADAAALRSALLEKGLTPSAGHASADVVVLNTCTVTAAADSQARDAIRKIHRANPGACVVVTGCYAQRAPEELAAMEGVAWVVGNSHQAEIPDILQGVVAQPARADFFPLAQLEGAAMSLARGPARILTGDIFAQTAVQIAPATLMAGDRTRPILKIQDGCNNRCSYCVIPFVRGRSRSLPPDDVIREVWTLVDAGAREIVLSGINLGSYGRDLVPRAGLAGVVQRILDETELEQLRFSSIEPQDITEDFVALVASSDRLAPHFHAPLQSGSDRILRAMHRWYRSEHYAERVSLIRRALADAAIGADVIAGFPGETEEDFRATFAFIERQPFTYLHVFSFSTRPGTAAANLGGAVRLESIRERARSLRALGLRKSEEFRRAQAGRAVRALTLGRGGQDWTEALTGNYLKLRIPGRHPVNEWHDIRIPADAQDLADPATPARSAR